MSAWAVATASLAWLAISAAVTAGAIHMIELWTIGMVAAYALFEAIARVRRYRKEQGGHDGDVSAETPDVDPAAERPPAVSAPDTQTGPEKRMASRATTGDQSVVAMGPPSAQPEQKGATMPVVLTAEEVADLLVVELDDLLEAMRVGTLPGNQVGGNWRCSVESLTKWLDGKWPSASGDGEHLDDAPSPATPAPRDDRGDR